MTDTQDTPPDVDPATIDTGSHPAGHVPDPTPNASDQLAGDDEPATLVAVEPTPELIGFTQVRDVHGIAVTVAVFATPGD